MEEEQIQQQAESVGTSTQVLERVEQEKKLEDLPRLEDLRKSEQEVKTRSQIQGVTQVEQKTQTKDRIFTRKSDEKKAHLKKRLKIVTSVYVAVTTLLLAFVGVNIATQVILNKAKTSNTQTIESVQQSITLEQAQQETGVALEEYQISLNEPRDYSEDKKELTFLDKLTILFRNIFG